jgi:hypothetical protein
MSATVGNQALIPRIVRSLPPYMHENSVMVPGMSIAIASISSPIYYAVTIPSVNTICSVIVRAVLNKS